MGITTLPTWLFLKKTGKFDAEYIFMRKLHNIICVQIANILESKL